MADEASTSPLQILPLEIQFQVLDDLDITALCMLARSGKVGRYIVNNYAKGDPLLQWLLANPVKGNEHADREANAQLPLEQEAFSLFTINVPTHDSENRKIRYRKRSLARAYEARKPGFEHDSLAGYTPLQWRVIMRQLPKDEIPTLEQAQLKSLTHLAYKTDQIELYESLDEAWGEALLIEVTTTHPNDIAATLLQRATVDGCCHVIQLAIDMGVEVNVRTTLHAASTGYAPAVKLLLQAEQPSDISALHEAAWRDSRKIINTLVKAGANVDACNARGETPLNLAAFYGKAAAAEALIGAGANVNTCRVRGETPLHTAAVYGHTAVAELLIRAGADVNARAINASQSEGGTPLHLAAWHNHPGVVHRLLQANEVNVDTCDFAGKTPLHHAVSHGGPETVTLLLDAGANINKTIKYTKKGNIGDTPLHYAAWSYQDDVTIRILALRGAKLNSRNKFGITPLFYAVQKGGVNAVNALLAIPGVEPTISDWDDVSYPNPFGATPLQCAQKMGNEEIITLLEQACEYRPSFSPLKVTGLVLGSILVAAGIGAAFTGLAPAALTAFFVAHMSVKLATFVTASLFAALGGFSTLATALTAITTHKTCYPFNPAMPVLSVLASEYLYDKRDFPEGSADAEDSETHVMTIGDEATETAALH